MSKKPNVIFIVMDALRSKNLGCYGYKRNTSPNIDSLAKKGVVFLDAFSSNNATDKSVLSILSGRHTLLGEKKDVLLTKEELRSFFNSGGVLISDILKERGYKTYCLKEIYGWQKKGFDYFYSFGGFNKEKKRLWEKIEMNYKPRDFFRMAVHHAFPKNLGDKVKAKYGRTNGLRATEDAIKIIKKSKKEKENFFMWIDYNDTHIPYNPKEFTGKFSSKPRRSFFKKVSRGNYNLLLMRYWRGAFSKRDSVQDIIDRYDSAIFYDDYLIGRVIQSLKEENLFENTIIFFFSDHGESFEEHEIYFDHHGLYDVSMNFPFIVVGKGLPKNKKLSGFVQHEDFIPTILDLLNIPCDSSNFDGKSLIPLIKEGKKIRSFTFMEEGDKMRKRAIRTKKYRYIESESEKDALCSYCNKIHGGVRELYDLDNDPGEENNLAEKNIKTVEKLKKKLDGEIKNYKRMNEKRRLKKVLNKIKKEEVL